MSQGVSKRAERVSAPAGVALVAAVLCAVAGEAPGQDAGAAAPVMGVAPGRVLVQLRAGGGAGVRAGQLSGDARTDAVLGRYRASALGPVSAGGFARPDLASALGLDRWRVALIDPAADPEMAAAELRGCAAVERAEADGLGGTADGPNDPSFPLQWGLANTGANGPGAGIAGADIRALQGWPAQTLLRKTVLLAVIDTGIDASHPELAGLVVPGWNVVSNNNQTVDNLCPHGSMIAGVSGALTNNAAGIAGVCWNVRLMPVRVLEGCSGTEANCAAGIIYAADHGAEVANMSLQYYTGTTVFAQAVTYAHQSGMVMVCAAGNYAGNVVAWPARFPETIAVSATTNRDQLASFSNYGPEIDLAAPGDQVYATYYGGGYTTASGTSLASPFVAGAACVARSVNPGMTAAETDAVLRAGGDDLGTPGRDQQFGYGRLNLGLVVQGAAATCYANCDGSAAPPVLNVADFQCFITRFAGGEAWANCDGSTADPVLNVADFTCYLQRFAAGCVQ
jgi:subtilisin family serine protease